MARIRVKGNQLELVHGVRDPETRKVAQQTLFVLSSKAEARAAIGDDADRFRHRLEQDHPWIRFDWGKIGDDIRAHLDRLPDLYPYRAERVERPFDEALQAFVTELAVADPQHLAPAGRLLRGRRHELAFLRELIDWRLAGCDQEESKWSQDNEYYWQTTWARGEVPPELYEKLGALHDEHRWDELEAVARLVTRCWPDFAAGFNSLGTVAVERLDLEAALAHLREATRVGRKAFPKDLPKELYWDDIETRPYIRSIVYQVDVLSRLERHDEALELCDRLESECGQDLFAHSSRATACLNAGHLEQAEASARYVVQIYPSMAFPLALALVEQGRHAEALAYLVHGTIRFPRTARMLTGKPGRPPASRSPEVDDHNTGVHLCREIEPYLRRQRRAVAQFVGRVVSDERVRALADEAAAARAGRRASRGSDRTHFDRMTEMESLPFARAQAERLTDLCP